MKHTKRTLSIAAGVGLGMIAVSPAMAQMAGTPADSSGVETVGRMGDVQVFAGLRLWANAWDMVTLDRRPIVDPANPSSILWRDEKDTNLTDTEIVPMPTIGVRYGRVIGSVTYFVPTSYDSDGGLSRSVKRSELDVNVGYLVLPSLLVSIGYKTAKIDRLTDLVADSEQRIQGLLVGASASAPMTDKLSLYGNLAYGIARQKADFKDARGEDRYSARYTIGEVGMSYRLLDREAAFVKSVSASVGYRLQTYTTKGVGLGTYASFDSPTALSTVSRDARSSTSGVVIAVVASF